MKMTHPFIEELLEQYADIFSYSTEAKLHSFSEGESSYDDLLELFESIAESACGEVRDSGYSGRSMYGKQCWAIVGDDVASIIETAAQHGVTGAKWDSMGLNSVVYWPRIQFVQNDSEDDE
jgi:hypothetical protein